MKPLCIDLYAGLGGWTEAFLAEGYRCVGFDIERHDYGAGAYPGQLVIQDVRTIHGSQFKDATVIVGSSPCQEFSYRAMPWSRAKALGPPLLGIELFEAQFRIQREACEAAGRYIPMVVENVRGAQKWVGRAKWHYGSFYLWGDVPALMPISMAQKVPGFRFDGSGRSFQTAATKVSMPTGGDSLIVGFQQNAAIQFRQISPTWRAKHYEDTDKMHQTGIKQSGISGPRDNGKGDKWFQDGAARHGSKSNSRKAASAQIAKIPMPLSRHIARAYKP